MVRLESIVKRYDAKNILMFKDITFNYAKSYCILGPSGSGKTSLLNLINGVIRPTSGTIIVDGDVITDLTGEELQDFRYVNIGYISQDFKLLDAFTVEDNLNISVVDGLRKRSNIEALELVGLKHKLTQKVITLSGGEKQRLSIARMFLKSPSVILCDEPTGLLPHEQGKQIIDLLVKEAKSLGVVLIVVTHDDRLTTYFDEVIQFEELLLGGVEDYV